MGTDLSQGRFPSTAFSFLFPSPDKSRQPISAYCQEVGNTRQSRKEKWPLFPQRQSPEGRRILRYRQKVLEKQVEERDCPPDEGPQAWGVRREREVCGNREQRGSAPVSYQPVATMRPQRGGSEGGQT